LAYSIKCIDTDNICQSEIADVACVPDKGMGVCHACFVSRREECADGFPTSNRLSPTIRPAKDCYFAADRNKGGRIVPFYYNAGHVSRFIYSKCYVSDTHRKFLYNPVVPKDRLCSGFVRRADCLSLVIQRISDTGFVAWQNT